MFDPLLVPELREMLLENDARAMTEFCQVLYPAVAAENLEALESEEIWRVLSQAPLSRRVEIFEFFSLDRQREIVTLLDRESLSALIEAMAPDDRADLLETLPEDLVDKLLPLMAQAERSDIRKLLSYPEHSAGSIMTTEYASLPEEITVAESLHRLRSQAPNRATIYYIYVLDEGRRLRGFTTLRKIILAKPDTQLSHIMERDVISVRVDEDQEQVARKIARYDFIAIPVVDDQNRLVGIITHDDILDVVQEEATEDAHRQGAVGPLEGDYLTTPLLQLVWKRIVWLILLFGAALLTAYVTSQYNHVLQMYTWVATFIPLVIASGGNAGSQSATLVIRTLALGETKSRTWHAIPLRELLSGLWLGGMLAVLGFLPAWWMSGTGAGAVVISGTVASVVLMGTLLGSVLPLMFKRLGMDPALMSNPLIAAVADLSGVVIYFNLVLLVVGKKLS